MRITDVFLQTGGVESLKKSQGTQKPQAKANQAPAMARAKDTYTASGNSTGKAAANAEAQGVKAHATAAPEVRESRISEVKDRIASGYYNSEEFKDKLADRLINDLGI